MQSQPDLFIGGSLSPIARMLGTNERKSKKLSKKSAKYGKLLQLVNARGSANNVVEQALKAAIVANRTQALPPPPVENQGPGVPLLQGR